MLGRLAADAEIAVERINELLEGDRASDVELQKLAQRLVKAFSSTIVLSSLKGQDNLHFSNVNVKIISFT